MGKHKVSKLSFALLIAIDPLAIPIRPTRTTTNPTTTMSLVTEVRGVLETLLALDNLKSDHYLRSHMTSQPLQRLVRCF